MLPSKKRTNLIKSAAKDLGFLSCGISKAEFLEEEAPRLEQWLQDGKHGKMAYMEKHFDKRLDPRLLVPGAKSVVSLLLNYYNDEIQKEGVPKISKYAYGADYHIVFKQKLNKLLQTIHDEVGEINGRVFVDSAPVMDKAWATRSGLGWMGKNTNLITQKVGSFFFIAELIIDLELEYDTPVTDHCGNCTACIDSCPTEALTPYNIDASKCISYLTIELKDQIPDEFQNKMDNWAFGCDVCQDVCPWNRFSKSHSEPLFDPQPQILDFTKKDWEELTEATFETIFKNSALKRTRFDGFKRNLSFLSQ
uniref:Epoxyqueuosine reductase n=1 Tax=uncultured Flavobacteriia bacterium TaxID=212695 RepID=H6RH30_9BACT|nr:epoxyqueuosine reductase [uncultured bacterium]CCG00341.1 iron-sulfur cluster binding protein [uncultured Flavobacteriia bacterium]|tara:strand:- start:68 stop:988 length:921 start_codon:yes stop_codon:yes gene_type:complete